MMLCGKIKCVESIDNSSFPKNNFKLTTFRLPIFRPYGVGEWRKTLTGTPYLVLFIILISISVGTASALITITLAGNVLVTGTLTAEKYFDNGNTQIGLDSSALGGIGNVASGTGTTVGGGISNTASSIKSTVGGGNDNIASQGQSTIGGGAFNEASGLASTIGGGVFNDATGELSTVGGGSGNVAMGLKSTVPGGEGNQAIGDYSFAAGRLAIANHDGSIVFADSTAANFESTAVDQFSIRAANGLRLVGDLTVSDGITSNDYNFPSPKTKLRIITSVSFDADSTVLVKSKNNGIGKYISTTSTEFTPLSAPINIPNGATIKTVKCFVLDNSPTEDVECSLLSYLLGSAPGLFASVSTSGEDPSNQQILMTGLSEQSFGQFFVEFKPTDKACDSLCAIFRVDVTYEISKAG